MFTLETKRLISSMHHLPKHKGKCKNRHGHNWTIHVKLDSLNLSADDMVMDFGSIKKIIDQYDHTTLNRFMENPTAEIFARKLAVEIALAYHKEHNETWPDGIEIRVEETPNNIASFHMSKDEIGMTMKWVGADGKGNRSVSEFAR